MRGVIIASVVVRICVPGGCVVVGSVGVIGSVDIVSSNGVRGVPISRQNILAYHVLTYLDASNSFSLCGGASSQVTLSHQSSSLSSRLDLR
jgi:hypothetical protein